MGLGAGERPGSALATLLPMKAVLCAILAGLCWGVGEIFTKWALNTGVLGPMAAQMVRLVIAQWEVEVRWLEELERSVQLVM